MSDPVKMEQAIRIVLKREQEGDLLPDAARAVLANALEGKAFDDKSCTAPCPECGKERQLPISRGYLARCGECMTNEEEHRG